MNLETRIIKESFGILIIASILSGLGGIGLEYIQKNLFTILPLLILFPALNSLVADFGAIFDSRYSVLLHQKKSSRLLKKHSKKDLIMILSITVLCGFYLATLSSVVAYLKGFPIDPTIFIKIILTALITSIILVLSQCLVSISAGKYFIKKKEDPDNLLIPLTASIAELGTMVIFSLVVYLLF